MSNDKEQSGGESLGQSVASGAAWLTSGNIFSRLLGFISIIVLARFLVPEDFGLIAMAVSIYALLDALSGLGFQGYLIQHKEAGREHYDTVWTLTILRGFLIAGVLVLLAGPAASFWGDGRIEGLVYLYALSSIIFGFINVGVVDLLKDLHFKRNFFYRSSARFAGFGVGITLAVVLQNYWAIALGTLATQTVMLVASYIVHPYRPRLALVAWQEIWRFSGWVLLRSIILFFGRRSDRMLLGRMVGMEAAGIYDVGQEAANMPSSEFVVVLSEAILAGFTRLADQPAKLAKAYARAIAMILSLSLPAGIGIALVAEPFVHVVLTDRFIEAVPLIQILAFYGILVTGLGNMHAVYIAVGRPARSTAYQAIDTAIRLPLLFVGISMLGMVGAAWAMLASAIFGLIVGAVLIVRDFGVSLSGILKQVWRVAFATGIMALAVSYVLMQVGQEAYVMQLLAAVAMGIVVYVGALASLWHLSNRPDGPEQFAIDWVSSRFKSSQ